jgi:dipeptidyl aminopeptidase/acylaminoacyl peptidase
VKGINRVFAGLGVVASLILWPFAATAEDAAPEAPPPLIATSDFAGRAAFWDAELSPDGTMLSYLRRKDGETQFIVASSDLTKVVSAFTSDPDDQFEWYRWVGNDKLLISVSTAGMFFNEEVRYTRLILVEVQSGVMTRLFARTDVVEGDNVIHVAKDGSYILVAIQNSIYEYPSVMRHELKAKGKVDIVQSPREGVWNWIADDTGVVRMGTGWSNGRLKIHYRADAASDLKLIARLKEDDTADRYWDALQIISSSDEGYVLSEGENGRVGLRRFNFATRETTETVFEHPEWDIDSVTLREGKPYAAFFTADRDEVHWFDPAKARQHAALRKALGDVEVWIIDRAEDDSKMLVWAGNESDPGVLYMYEPAAKRMKELAQYRPRLDFRLLAKPRPIRYTARDGTVIRGYLTLPRGRAATNLPLIVMPHGGPFGVRDKLEYNDEVQLLANRGYAVLQPNFRGSGGYGDAFFELGEGQVGRGMQDDIDDAMDWAVAEGIADPKRVCVVGGSYGGYAALWAVLRNPERYRCAASWAGVTDWNKMLSYDRRYLTGRAGKAWQARVRGEKTFDLDAVSPYRVAGKLSRPVLLAHGTKDSNVPFSQYTLFEKATRSAPVRPQTLVIAGEGHSFSKAESEQQWYDALDAFLAQHNPADPLPAAAPVRAAASEVAVPAAAQ